MEIPKPTAIGKLLNLAYPCHVLFNICDLRFFCSRNAGDGNVVKKTLRLGHDFFDPFIIRDGAIREIKSITAGRVNKVFYFLTVN